MESSRMFWEQAYREHAPMMLGACLRYVSDQQIAEDLMHDAFMAAICKSGTYDGRGCLAAWLRRIAVNTALMHLRGLKPSVSYDAWIDTYTFEPMEHVPENNQPESLDLSHQQLLEIISQLPDHHRTVFNLYVIDDFSHEQIAEQLSISPGTSKSHLARARKRLREMLLSQVPAEQRRRLPILFIMPFGWNNVDSYFKSRLAEFSVVPTRSNLPDFMNQVDWSAIHIPSLQIPIPQTYWLNSGYIATASTATAVMLATGMYLNISLDTEAETAIPHKLHRPDTATTLTYPQTPIDSVGMIPDEAHPQVVVRQTIIEHRTIVVRDTITLIDTTNAE